MLVAESLKSRREPRAFRVRQLGRGPGAPWPLPSDPARFPLQLVPHHDTPRSQATSADAKTVDRPRAGTAVTCGLCSQPLGEQQPYAPAKMPGNVGAHEKASMVNVPYRNPSSAGISKAPRDRLPGLPLTRRSRPVIHV